MIKGLFLAKTTGILTGKGKKKSRNKLKTPFDEIFFSQINKKESKFPGKTEKIFVKKNLVDKKLPLEFEKKNYVTLNLQKKSSKSSVNRKKQEFYSFNTTNHIQNSNTLPDQKSKTLELTGSLNHKSAISKKIKILPVETIGTAYSLKKIQNKQNKNQKLKSPGLTINSLPARKISSDTPAQNLTKIALLKNKKSFRSKPTIKAKSQNPVSVSISIEKEKISKQKIKKYIQYIPIKQNKNNGNVILPLSITDKDKITSPELSKYSAARFLEKKKEKQDLKTQISSEKSLLENKHSINKTENRQEKVQHIQKEETTKTNQKYTHNIIAKRISTEEEKPQKIQIQNNNRSREENLKPVFNKNLETIHTKIEQTNREIDKKPESKIQNPKEPSFLSVKIKTSKKIEKSYLKQLPQNNEAETQTKTDTQNTFKLQIEHIDIQPPEQKPEKPKTGSVKAKPSNIETFVSNLNETHNNQETQQDTKFYQDNFHNQDAKPERYYKDHNIENKQIKENRFEFTFSDQKISIKTVVRNNYVKLILNSGFEFTNPQNLIKDIETILLDSGFSRFNVILKQKSKKAYNTTKTYASRAIDVRV